MRYLLTIHLSTDFWRVVSTSPTPFFIHLCYLMYLVNYRIIPLCLTLGPPVHHFLRTNYKVVRGDSSRVKDGRSLSEIRNPESDTVNPKGTFSREIVTLIVRWDNTRPVSPRPSPRQLQRWYRVLVVLWGTRRLSLPEGLPTLRVDTSRKCGRVTGRPYPLRKRGSVLLNSGGTVPSKMRGHRFVYRSFRQMFLDLNRTPEGRRWSTLERGP